MAYDEAGNLTNATVSGSQFQYTWDGLNTMKFYQSEAESKVFSYDAEGERLETFRCNNSCGEGESYERLTLRGLAGEVLRVFQASGQTGGWVEDYVYADGRPLARVRNDGFGTGGETPVTEFLHLDHLGSVRVVTDSANTQVAYHEYFPFGEEATSVSLDDSILKFTGHERDDGPGSTDEMDYMHARYCGPLLGRFLLVDPIGGTEGRPQSWNQYAYVANNPVKAIDPTGETIIFPMLDEPDEESEEYQTFLSAFEEAGATEEEINALALDEVDGEIILTSDKDLSGSSNPTVSLVGAAIKTDTRIQISFGPVDKAYGGAVTDSKYFAKQNLVKIKLDPKQIASTLLPGYPLKGPLKGQQVGLQISVATALVHELGHAYGNFKMGVIPTFGATTKPHAMNAENAHRALSRNPTYRTLHTRVYP